MLTALASADNVTWVSIIVKALAYAATLSAVGAVLVLAVLREVDEAGRAALRRTAVVSAVASAVLSALRLPVRASFLMGGTWDGAFDATLLRLVVESPLGESVALRLVGLTLILCVIWRSRVGQSLALLGALIASASFTLRGHALSEPQTLLALLMTLHILCLAFWIGAFAPLVRSAKSNPPAETGALAHAFGRKALWAVGILVLVGGLSLALLGAVTPTALSSAYGQMFAVKLILFAVVLFLAAFNKLKLTPALLASAPDAGVRLRRSIRIETVLVAGILLTTSTLTSVSSPPRNEPSEKTSHAILPFTQAHLTFGDAS